MIFGLNENGERIDIEDSLKGEKYYCPCCGGELIQKKGIVNAWHFAHKSSTECDNWYEENEWCRKWVKLFDSDFREVIIKNENYDKKRVADVKYKRLVLKLQPKSLSSEEFKERIDYFSKENNLVYLVDCRNKDIEYTRTQRTHNYIWKHAYKFGNIDKYTTNFHLFLQISDSNIIRVVWNKEGFKYFGGYTYSINEFKEVLEIIANDGDLKAVTKYDYNRYREKCSALLEKCLKVDMSKYNYKLKKLLSEYSAPYVEKVIRNKIDIIEYSIYYKILTDEGYKVNYAFKIIENTLKNNPRL